MSASTALSAVLKMLDTCAPGYTIRLANHSRVITFSGKLYRTFPKHDPVENGHVRKLVRVFGIAGCASKQLPDVIKDPVEPVPGAAAHADSTSKSQPPRQPGTPLQGKGQPKPSIPTNPPKKR